MPVKMARNGDVELAYETFGAPGGQPLLLIMGLGHQMLWWPDGFCEHLVRAGFFVARFDNRDSGLSTHFDHTATDDKWWKSLLGRGAPPPYGGDDFVRDALAVMDALGWVSAHIAGGSMGGGICQALAADHPSRVRSMTTLVCMPASTSLGGLRHLRFGPILAMARKRYAADAESQQQRLVDLFRALASPGRPFDERWARDVARRSHARRPFDPRAERRQLAAGRRRGRSVDFGRITAPALVVYGEDDPLVRPSGSKALARKIKGAKLIGYPGMGHELPAHVWADLAGEMARLATIRS
ncbi:alpha/beta fold hydrolase [Allorhizocola rhizosphaerae]|uniref:alpha/beta fold hydrolase n=1 Tax=Allorhizocola rhizosphaerae TaxID=1872709 RepID=UPI000E3DB075|nr:alpha/beta hydrolase [Allorhizocola rhizosphaerae]